MAPYMDNPQTLVGMVMTYDGYFLVVASGNGIAIIDRHNEYAPSRQTYTGRSSDH